MGFNKNVIIPISLMMIFYSCNKNYPLFRPIEPIKNTNGLPKLSLIKDSILTIKSISAVERYLYGGNLPVQKARVNKLFYQNRSVPKHKRKRTYNYTFTRVSNNLQKLAKKNEYPIQVALITGVNDSVYKSVMDSFFLNNFKDRQVQPYDFSAQKQDGIYLVVTNLFEYHTTISQVSEKGNASTITMFDFFKVVQGKAISYRGFRLSRILLSYNKQFPIYNDIRKIIRRWYEVDNKKK